MSDARCWFEIITSSKVLPLSMNFKDISSNIETSLEALFDELRSGIASREDSRAFGAMIERRITDNWKDICNKFGYEYYPIPGRRSIFDFACKVDGTLIGFDVKTKDLDTTRYSDGGVCAVGNLLKFLANDDGVFMIVEFGHDKSSDKGGRDLEYIRVAPFHVLPTDIYRIENLGTGQVRMNYTLNQVWEKISWDRSYPEFFDVFCDLSIKHYNRVKADADNRITSMNKFKKNDYKFFKFD